MRRVVAVTIALLAAGPAWTSGGLFCTAEDKNGSIEVESGVTRGMGGPAFNFRGTVDLKAKAIAADLAKLSFEHANLAQYWLDGKELNLVVYREREGDKPHGYVELLIETKVGKDESSYAGRYVLSVFDATDPNDGEGKTTTVKGRISCSVE